MRPPEYLLKGMAEFLRPFYPALTTEGIREWLRFIPRGATQTQLSTITDAAKCFNMPATTLRLRVKQAGLEPVETRPSRGGFTRYYQLTELARISGVFREATPESGNVQAPAASPEDLPPAHISS